MPDLGLHNSHFHVPHTALQSGKYCTLTHHRCLPSDRIRVLTPQPQRSATQGQYSGCICTLETEQEISSKSRSEWNTARKQTNRRGSAPPRLCESAASSSQQLSSLCVCVSIAAFAQKPTLRHCRAADCQLKTLLPNLFADWFAFNCVNILSKRR
jgi:hypothetical protein